MSDARLAYVVGPDNKAETFLRQVILASDHEREAANMQRGLDARHDEIEHLNKLHDVAVAEVAALRAAIALVVKSAEEEEGYYTISAGAYDAARAEFDRLSVNQAGSL